MDLSKECVAEIGSYVQGHGHETSNNQRTRTIDGIYLGPTDSIQGNHEILDLNTKKTVTRPFITVLPITKQVINIVEQMAHDEGVKDLRTYHWKNGEIILDGDLLAGVDPDELWDETYTPNNNEEKRNDENLRNEEISEAEIEELMQDAEEFIGNYFDEENDEYQESRSVASIYERIRNKDEEEESEESEQNDNPNEEQKDEEQLFEEIEEIEEEIERTQSELESLNDENYDENTNNS